MNDLFSVEKMKESWENFLSFLERENFFYDGMKVFRAEQLIYHEGVIGLLNQPEEFLDQVAEELEFLGRPELKVALELARSTGSQATQAELRKQWFGSRRKIYKSAFTWLNRNREAVFERYTQFFGGEKPEIPYVWIEETKASSLPYRLGKAFFWRDSLQFGWVIQAWLWMSLILKVPELIQDLKSPLHALSFGGVLVLTAWQFKPIRFWLLPLPSPPPIHYRNTDWRNGISRESLKLALELDQQGVARSLMKTSSASSLVLVKAIDYVGEYGIRSLFEKSPLDVSTLAEESAFFHFSELTALIDIGKQMSKSRSGNRVQEALAWVELRKKWDEQVAFGLDRQVEKTLNVNPFGFFDRYPELFQEAEFVPGNRI